MTSTVIANHVLNTQKKSTRIGGLDSIRFVCALIVVVGHFGIPLPESLGPNAQGIYRILRAAIGCSFNGPAAVIVFFVISGFCIHYPFRFADPTPLRSYYARRLIRIGLPAIVAIGIWLLCGKKIEPPEFNVFWSIICEIIYYVIYPPLLVLQRRIGWMNLIVVAYLASYAIVLSNVTLLTEAYNGYVALGYWTWVVGLPCWLLGCWLADNFHRFSVPSTAQIWSIRITVLLVTTALQLARFHAHSFWGSYCITLNAFAILACVWVGYEIAFYRERSPWPLLERCGKWSYSLYLMHIVAPTFVGKLDLGIIPHEIVWLAAAFAISYGFFLTVELPSHRLAVYLGRGLSSA